MTLQVALNAARAKLREAGIEDAGLEAEVLLRHALGLDRAGLFTRLREEMPEEALQRFEGFLQRRLQREPTSYITGRREFYGFELLVTPATLIPRPETELLVDAALELARTLPVDRTPRLVDVGTGSGAIAIALSWSLPAAEVYAIEQSAAGLAVARENASRLGAAQRISFRRGDLLSPLDVYVDVIVANLPYVKSGDIPTLQPEVRDYEPIDALDGGPDGLHEIRRLLRQAPAYLRPGGCICLEFGDGQTDGVRQLCLESFPQARVEVLNDLAGLPRVATLSTRANA